MGHQLNFWMTQSDEFAFVGRLRQIDAVWTLYALEYGEEPQLNEFDDWVPNDSGQRIIVIQRANWNWLEWRHISKSDYPHIPHFAEWTMVGTGASPCFEWDTCKRGEDFISRGRIYFRTDWLQGEQIYVKPDESTKWFDRLAGWLRRRATRWEYSGQWLLPGAAEALKDDHVRITCFEQQL